MDNLEIYNKVRKVPNEAKREIQAGRLKGKTDINPMWRLKALTETFGVCGFGWKYEITERWLERSDENTVSAFVNINLYVKMNDVWSDAIPGTGGSNFTELQGTAKYLYTNDECFKMALTDAISVACKALGIGADVYWDKDTTKYGSNATNAPSVSKTQTQVKNPTTQKEEITSDIAEMLDRTSKEIESAKTVDDLNAIWYKYPELQNHDLFKLRCTNRKGQLTMKK